MEPGLLDQPVTIEESTGQDEFGSQIVWTQVCQTKADIQPVSGTASTESAISTGEAHYQVNIRYRRGIDANQRIRFRADQKDYTLLILYVLRQKVARARELQLFCKEYQV
jgi:head-tail adaptor